MARSGDKSLQTFEITRPVKQPIQPLVPCGDEFLLPNDLVEGLQFLRPFLKRGGDPAERWAHLISGKLYLFTNDIFMVFELEASDVPDMKFSAGIIRALEAFGTPPKKLVSDVRGFLFEWADDQQLFVECEYDGLMNGADDVDVRHARASTLDKYWALTSATVVDEAAKKLITSALSGSKLCKSIYVAPLGIIARQKSSDDHSGWTSEHFTPFASGANRIMRFGREAFRAAVKVSTQMDFNTSPVSFQFAKGRGLLIEKTLGPDVPEIEVWND